MSDTDKYHPGSKDGTLYQQAQYWLEKACYFAADPNLTEEQRKQRSEMAFNMAVKKEAEATAGK